MRYFSFLNTLIALFGDCLSILIVSNSVKRHNEDHARSPARVRPQAPTTNKMLFQSDDFQVSDESLFTQDSHKESHFFYIFGYNVNNMLTAPALPSSQRSSSARQNNQIYQRCLSFSSISQSKAEITTGGIKVDLPSFGSEAKRNIL